MSHHESKLPSPDDTTEDVVSPAPSLSSASDPLIGTKIGSCTLKRIIGSGGMGTVYEAIQEKPRRRVALKMMKRGITSRSATRRFEFESQTLARLQHPGVAQIYEAGTHDDGSGGVPYFVMEYVASAKSITQYADDKKLGTRDRLALFSKVCDAVQHGHLKGIVHRDLKPGNILVDASGQPKVIDFGVARSTDSDLAVTTLQTDVGQLIGTLQYMSPEQCEADPSDIDGRSDVYALGVVLYELLIGKPPYNLQRMAIHEAVRIVREEEPTKLSTIDRHLRGDIETIAMKALEKDRDRRYQSATALEDDINCYLNDEPISARRPGAIDYLRRFTKKYKAASIAIISIFMVLASATIVTSIYVVVAWEMQDKAEEAVKVAEMERETATKMANSLALQAYYANIRAAEFALNEDDLLSAGRKLENAQENFIASYLFSLSPNEAPDILDVNSILPFEWKYLSSQCDDSAQTLYGPSYEEGDERTWLSTIAYSPDGSSIAMVDDSGFNIQVIDAKSGDFLYGLDTDKVLDTGVGSIAFSPDGKLLAYNGRFQDDKVVLWDLESGEYQVLDYESSNTNIAPTLSPIAFSPDGVHLALGTQGGAVYIWSVATGKEIATLQIAGSSGLELLSARRKLVMGIDYSSDGSILVSAGTGVIELWDTKTWVNIGFARVGMSTVIPVYDVSINTSGDLIAEAGSGDIHIWSVPLMRAMKIAETISEANAPETEKRKEFLNRYGSRLSETQQDLIENVSPTVAGELEMEFDRLIELSGVLIDIELNQILKEWATLYTSSPTTRIRVLSEPVYTIPGDWVICETIAFSPDDTILMATTRDGVGSQSPGSIRLWDLEREKYGEDNDATLGLPQFGREFKLVGHKTPVYDGIFSPDGKTVASYGGKQLLKIWEVTENASVDSILNKSGAFLSQVGKLSMSPDGSLLAVPLLPNVYIIDIASRSTIAILKPGVDKLSLDKKQDARTLLELKSQLDNGEISEEIYNYLEKRLDALPKLRRGTILSTAFSPDGKHLATGQSDGAITIWDLDTGQSIANLQIEKESEREKKLSPMKNIYNHLLSYSPDGLYIASVGRSSPTVHLLVVETGQEVGTLSSFNTEMLDNLIKDKPELSKISDLNTNSMAEDIAFSPDGKHLAIAYPFGTIYVKTEDGDYLDFDSKNGVYIWDLETMEPLATFNKLNNTKSSINSIAWAPNGAGFAFASDKGVINVWDLQNDQLIWEAAEHDGNVGDLEYSTDGQRLASCGEDKTINLWSAINGELLTTLRGHEQGVESVVFSPDNSLLVSSGGLDSVRFWDSRPKGQVALEQRLVSESTNEMRPVVSEWFDRAGGDKELVMAMLDRATTVHSPDEIRALRQLVFRRFFGQSVDIDAAFATMTPATRKEWRDAMDKLPGMSLAELEDLLRILKSSEAKVPVGHEVLHDAIIDDILNLIDAKRQPIGQIH